jgi:uncharacterized protein (TIGR03435 family)
VLEDRFQLKSRSESRETSAYGLTIAPRGPRLSSAHEGGGRVTFGDLNVPSMNINELCEILEFDLDRPVVNQTALSGPFAIQLQWSSERAPAANRANNEARPSLFTALQDQLGLRLEPIKAKVNFFVIDRVESPSEN